MYNLSIEGVRELSRSGLFRKAKVVREPLDGIPDSSNLVFRTQYKPLTETEDVTIFNTVSGGSVSSGSYTVDYDTGTVLFTDNAAPASQPATSYHWANLTTREFKQILLDGFDTMEAIFPRGWRVSSGSVTYTAATEDDTDIFIVAGNSVADLKHLTNPGDIDLPFIPPYLLLYQGTYFIHIKFHLSTLTFCSTLSAKPCFLNPGL